MSNNEIREKRKKVICDLVKDDFYVPMKEKELAMFLQVAKEDREEFREILRELLAEGKLTLTVKGKYMKSNGKVLTGTFISNAKGFGFVEVEGRDEDLFIPEDKQGGAFHKDTVEVALLPAKTGKRQEAQVIRIIARGMTQVVGTYEQSKSNFGFVIPDNTKIAQDIFVPKEWSKGAMTGHKVVVEITGYGTNTKSPEGKVVEILGHINDPGVDIMSIVRGFDLPVEFGEKIMSQVERVSQEVSEADCAGRRDLRDVTMVTIDGEDAKDLDDAVSVSFDGTYYHLGVHIADVTNYVQENSALDREALKRGTSVYLVDRVIPMLPHALSNGICSLNEGVDRLALSCLMKVDEEGEIVDYEICESVIRVNKRMSYTVVKKLLEEPECVEHNAGMPDGTSGEGVETSTDYSQYRELLPMFQQMAELADKLRKKRQKRGSIDFDFPECKILLDKEGHPLDIKPYERNIATMLIEDFMLAANETVAQHFYWQELPFVYRVHEEPNAEKLERLHALLQACGINDHFAKEVPTPKELSAILEGVRGTPYEQIINTGMLRCMSKALYEEKPKGHYGLVLKDYAHFTSPIRRYPDLAIHRIMTDLLKGTEKETMILRYTDFAERASKQSSEREVVAMQIERKAEDCYKAEYARRHLGECYEGTISGVTQRGLFIELDNGVEGFVPASSLTPSGTSLTEGVRLTDPASGKSWSLGDKMMITIVRADVNLGKIDFEVAPAAKN